MPRNGSGTYALPAGNPVTSGTLIEASWANTTLSDIASAVTDSLARSGEGGMTGPMRAADGTVSTPSVSFVSETATGFYRAGATDVRFAMAGVDVATLTTAGVTVGSTKVLALPDGTAAAPALTNTGDTNTGVFFPDADTVGVSTGGTERVRVDASGNVGVGTTSPTTKLDVSSSGTTTLRVNRLGVADVYLTAGANGIYGLDTASTNLHFGVGNSLKMTLDTSGNLGLGVTPSAGSTHIDVSNGGAYFGLGNGAQVVGNAYFSSSQWLYKAAASTPSARIDVNAGNNGSIGFFTAPSGTAGNAISFTQAMTLDASGNLGVGTTSPGVKLDVAGYIRATTNSAANIIESASDTQPVFRLSRSGGPTADFTAVGSYAELRTTNNYPLVFTTNSTERARITSGGNVCINTTSELIDSGRRLSVVGGSVAGSFKVASTSDIAVEMWNAATSGDNNFSEFKTEASPTLRGSITYNRGAGLVAYNTTSDYRAKDIIGPVQDPGSTIDALKVYEGKMKGATQSRPMLIAHEAQEHAPYAVSGVKDEVNEDGTPKFQQMDVSSLVPLLLAEIQSLRARVAQLEAQS